MSNTKCNATQETEITPVSQEEAEDFYEHAFSQNMTYKVAFPNVEVVDA